VRQKLEELKKGGEDRWEALKAGLESAWNELKSSTPRESWGASLRRSSRCWFGDWGSPDPAV